ncbi:MAG TPA: toast rack family protein [Bryobacteraceae bacterium]|nr:toast rack family protein [Bryobacteraceae bacterium]
MVATRAMLLAPLVFLCGCVIETAGPTQHDFRSIELDKSEAISVDFQMGMGNLRVDAGTQKLMRADFTYNVPSWKPYVRYDSGPLRSHLSIEQPSQHEARIGGSKYEWDVRLNREVPMDVNVHFGAGHAQLNLGSLTLRAVEVNMGLGRLEMDLRGNPKHNYDVHIKGGVGEVTVRLPGGVGVEAEAQGGIGAITAPGMRREGHRYLNASYDRSKVRIRLEIQGGVGAIQLISD